MTVFVNVGVEELDELLKAFSQYLGHSAGVVVAIEKCRAREKSIRGQGRGQGRSVVTLRVRFRLRCCRSAPLSNA